MKKLSIIILALALTQGVFAQKVAVRGGGHFYGGGRTVIVSRPYIGLGFGGYYNPYFYSGYPGYYRPYGYRPYGYHHTTKLDREIINIKDDYSDRIYSVRQDNSLTGKERRHKIRDLRHERNLAVEDAKVNYYKQY